MLIDAVFNAPLDIDRTVVPVPTQLNLVCVPRFEFHKAEWSHVSAEARDLISGLLVKVLGGGTKKNNSLKNMLRRLFYALIEMRSSYLQIFSAKTLVYFNVKSCVSSVYKLSTEWGLTCPKFQFVFQRLFLPCLGREEEVQRE